MWFKKNTQHKTRPKILTLFTAMLLCLSMAVPTLVSEPLQVQAVDDNVGGAGNDAKPENTTGGMGVSWNRTGWLVYISDINGNICSPVVFATAKQPPADADGSYLYSRIGNQAPSKIENLNNWTLNGQVWPLPVSSSGTNFAALKSYMKANVNEVIYGALGEQTFNTVKNDLSNYYLVLDVVSWHARPGGTDTTVASHWGYVNMWAAGQASPYGKAFYPYNKCAISEYIEKPWPGLPSPVTYLPGSTTECIPLQTLQGAGYGMAAFRLDLLDGGPQTTADEPKIPVPHDPPNESTGIKTIIKNYRTVNDTTNVVTDDGCTHRDNVDEHITIEEEGEYKVVGWKTSNTKNYTLDSITWPVPGKITQQGPTSGTVQLASPTETVLYVLLEKHISVPPTSSGKADFIISESTITRKIKLSYPDNSGIKILKDTTFRWERPDHKDKCDGHSYTDGCNNSGTDPNKYCGGHTAYCTYGKFTDNHTKLSLKNSKKSNFPDVLATKSGWEVITTTGLADHTKRYQEHSSGHITKNDYWSHSSWDYSCVLLRGKDKLTVASWKNSNLGQAAANTDLASVSSSGFSIGNSATGSRKTALYYDKFTFTIADDSPDLNTTYSTTSGSGHGNCGENTRTFSLKHKRK